MFQGSLHMFGNTELDIPTFLSIMAEYHSIHRVEPEPPPFQVSLGDGYLITFSNHII